MKKTVTIFLQLKSVSLTMTKTQTDNTNKTITTIREKNDDKNETLMVLLMRRLKKMATGK
ncbi:hypothetical protein E2C01_066679 [Portunus trituberculatus]|uniref:Uncharacterized protein n=1 Tax=Portunus trituberculatus TaxID=210409 RepID=A0A5B7HRM1_PORTR|nr:hypothetical protein [Portunus trituberculatus]